MTFVLVAGGTGRLGGAVVERLLAKGLSVRVLTRRKARAKLPPQVEVVEGDVRNPSSLMLAVEGATTVISSIQGFTDANSSPEATDWLGNRNLVDAAKAAGVEHFILASGIKSAPDHPMSIGRAKYHAEEYLKRSGVPWTIVRGTAFMEFWATLVGEPLLQTGKTQVFGRGNNPVNFVSVDDMAFAVVEAVVNSALRGADIEVGGPENLTMNQVAAIFERLSGRPGQVSHVPLPMMRVMSLVMKPFRPALARQIQAGVVMDTTDVLLLDPVAAHARNPWLPQTPLAEVIARAQRTSARAD